MRVRDEDDLAERAVDVVERALADTRYAFDGVAAGYHLANVENPGLSEMRRRALSVLTAHVPSGGRILDLGCGPGTDDETLGLAGFRVVGIDWSRVMVDEAQRRIDRAGLNARVDIQHLGIQDLDRLAGEPFDAAYSNFGPLNCVPDLSTAARALARRVRAGGVVVASVIGRVCPWEIALYVCRGDWARVRVRFEGDMVAVPLDGRTAWTRYYTPREFARPFEAEGFRRVTWRALALAAPPPYLAGFAARHPRLTRGLHRVDDWIGAWPGVRACGDHFLIVLVRR